MVERGLGGLDLGLFFAATAATAKFSALPDDGGDEVLGMVGTFFANDLIDGRRSADGLHEFLELAFGIGVQRAVAEGIEVFGKEACSELLCGIAASVEMNGAGDGFERIGEGGFAITAAIGLFTTAHAQMRTKTDAAGDAGEGLGGNKLGACLREHAFIGLGQTLEEQMGERELQHGIAEEFEALIVCLRTLGFIADTAVRERELEQRGIAKGVSENGFQRVVHAWRRLKPLEHRCSSEKSGVTDGIRTRNNQNHNLGLYR